MGAFAVNLSRHHIELHHPVHFIPEHLDAHSPIVVACGKNLNDISANSELPTFKSYIIAFVTDIHQFPKYIVPVHFLPFVQGQHHLMVAFR